MNKAVNTHRSKAEHVAQQLLERIIAAKLKPGSSFATEAELLPQFNVSRPTLRESLKLLESQGVLERRPGPGGGIIVREPSIDLLAHGLSVFLRLHEVPFSTVLQAREVIEPALAQAAAISGTEAHFAELAASIARMKALDAQRDQDTFLEENRVFHSIIARAGGNKVLEVFWNTISVLAAGEPADSPRARAQAGPSVTAALHMITETGHGEAPPSGVVKEALARYRQMYEGYAPATRHLDNHRGHSLFVRPEEAPILSGELIRALTRTGTEDELVASVRQIREAGFSQFGIQLRYGHEMAMLEDWARVLEKV
mgnify:CR=1 FL=1